MYLLSPVTYPIARLLDWFLGEDDGIVFGKRRLKTLISLQKSLSEEEVTIVSAALDLKETQVSSIMTPLSHIFALGSEVQLNDLLRHKLWASGFNQIPVHAPGDPTKFVGVVFAKDLIINESGQIATVKEMNIAHLPVVSPDLSCLDMLKFFRSGMSRMVLVTECGTNGGRAIGIITIRNVIENLINCNL
jgi:metal transporter CNNM